MLRVLFVDKREVFAIKLSFEEFNLVFLTADQSANRGSEVSEETWGTFCIIYGQGKYVFKRELLFL